MATQFTNAFVEALTTRGINYTLTPFGEQVFTTQRVAEIAKVAEEAIGKAMLVGIGKQHAIALIPGNDRLDLKALKEIVQQKVYLPNKQQVAKVTGIEAGAITPLLWFEKPHLTVYADRSLLQFDTINISTGDHEVGVNVNPKELYEALDAQEVDIAQKRG